MGYIESMAVVSVISDLLEIFSTIMQYRKMGMQTSGVSRILSDTALLQMFVSSTISCCTHLSSAPALKNAIGFNNFGSTMDGYSLRI